jgi:hypothetical protein
MRHLRTIIKMAVLAGYLITVIAALPLHHCDIFRSDAIRGGGHRRMHTLRAKPVRLALPSDDRASISRFRCRS